jgi:hypothetical protein
MFKAHRGTHFTTWFHWNSQGFEICTRGGKKSLCTTEQRGRKTEGEKELLTERSEEQAQTQEIAGARWSPVRGGRRRGSENRQRGREKLRKSALPRARAGKGFLKTGYGRTGQSTVSVRCTPDSAQ